jgi:hypothetical protein
MPRAAARRLEVLESRHLLAQVAGSIDVDTVWSAAESPYEVTGDIVVQPSATLTIEPGVTVNFRAETGIQVRGRLIAEGTPERRIELLRIEGQGRWDGLEFRDTLADNRVAFADMLGGDAQGEAINVVRSRLLLDNLTWAGTNGTILELRHPSLIVRNSQFPTSSGGEIIHGEQIEGDEYLIIDGNTFANSNNGGDVIDFLGAAAPGPVLQVLNNVFLGGGDDGLDLDGTDAHIEGNLFMNFRRNTSRNTTSNAIATGLPQNGDPNRSEITVVRNIFVDNDYALLLKEDAFAHVEHNIFLNSRLAAIQFNELNGTAVLGAGKGAVLRGNIFEDNQQLFRNLVDQPAFRTQLAADYNLMPNENLDWGTAAIRAHELGVGNVAGEPGFVDPAGRDYRLLESSPAKELLPNGLDAGAYVPARPVIQQREATTNDGSVTLDVSGPGITSYRYRLPGETLSELRPISTPIVLTGEQAAVGSLEVVAQNAAGEWYVGESASFGELNIELIAPRRVRSGEVLPMVARGLDWQYNILTSYDALQSLDHGGNLSLDQLRFYHGIAPAAPTVLAESDFQVMVGGVAQAVEVLPSDFPTQEVSGTIEVDTVWSPDIEYHVTGTLSVPFGVTLTIPAGTRVLLGDRVNVRVRGTLLSLGTLDQPNLFTALNQQQPWGGIEITSGVDNRLEHTFFTQGGADTSREFGHSNSQPVLRTTDGTITCDGCYVIDNVGKGLAAVNGRFNVTNSVISQVDTGGEFGSSIAIIDHTWLINIPDDGRQFVDDDNDGFYFAGAHPSGEPSRFTDSFVVNTKDDGIDHNGARLILERMWIENTTHEGIATSNRNWVTITDSVFTGSNQGVEAGYGSPDVTVSQSVVVGNRNQTDPAFPSTAGLRFGDGYSGSLGSYTGNISASYLVLHDNGDNIWNFDRSTGAAREGAIDITSSLANDADATDPSNGSGIPVFGPRMHLLRGSAGFTAGPDGMPVGRVVPLVTVELATEPSVDFNDDGVIDAADIDRFCAALHRTPVDLRFDLDGDQEVDEADRDTLIEQRLNTTYGDANLDGRFDSADLVMIFTRGQYEDDQAKNSGWADGDWNCDGEFNSRDLVLAFQRGSYRA